MSAAFVPQQGRVNLSTHRLTTFGEPSFDSNVERVPTFVRIWRYQILRNNRFAVLNLRAAKSAVYEGFGLSFVEKQAGALEQESAVV